MFLQAGCTASLYDNKLLDAENDLSMGKPMSDQARKTPHVILPPSIAARRTIAHALDAVILDKYEDSEAQEIRKRLAKVRRDPLVPHDQQVEAGYVMVLLDKIESLKNQNRAAGQQKDKCSAEAERIRLDNDRLKKDLEELKYKLEKIEEIHINTEKKRGVQ